MLYILLAYAVIGLAAAVATGVLLTRKVNTDDVLDYLLVLGTTVNGTEPSIMLGERIRAAYDYLTAHPDTVCIPTGGKDSDTDISEADCIKNKLMAMGMEEHRIWTEQKAVSTMENLRFSMALIEEKTGNRPRRLGFLTSDFHVYRVQFTARWLGIPATGIGSKSRHTIFYYPAFLREIIAVWYYKLLVTVKKPPTP